MILAFDISSTNIGVVAWQDNAVLWHRTIVLRGKDLGQRLLAAQREFLPLFPPQRPNLVAYEGPAYSKKNMLAVIAQAKTAGLLEVLCAGLGVPIVAITPSSAKKALSGSGKAEKAEMVRCAAAYLCNDYSEHEADALGVALAAAARRWRCTSPRRITSKPTTSTR